MALSGVNEKKIKTKSSEIIRLAEEASKKLQEFELLVKDSNAFFKGDIYNATESKTESMAVCFPTVKNNILSYSEDLLNLLATFKSQTEKQKLAIQEKKIEFEVK